MYKQTMTDTCLLPSMLEGELFVHQNHTPHFFILGAIFSLKTEHRYVN